MKLGVKIIILFVTTLTIIIGGWHMYHRLRDDRIAFESDIYAFVSPQSYQVIHVSRNHYFEQLYLFNDDFHFFIEATKKILTYPVLISTFWEGNPILLLKVNREQAHSIEQIVGTEIAPSYPPQKYQYKNAQIYTYALSDNTFLCTTTYKGVFAVSRDYRRVEQLIDIETEDSYFATLREGNLVRKLKQSSPIGIFWNVDGVNLALDLKVTPNKTLLLDGHILSRSNRSGTQLPPYMEYRLRLPDSYCIDMAYVDTLSQLKTMEIVLNKIE